VNVVDQALDWIGRRLARGLTQGSSGYQAFTHADPSALERTLRPGDVLLIAGNRKISVAIKYLTQSTWSHAALDVGDVLDPAAPSQERKCLIEVEVGQGCIAIPLSKYATFNTRICRPIGLSDEECRKVITFMIDRIGLQYDMRNIIDLLRYLLPTPPVPTRWRRRMIALGSGDPTRAICSTLIAQAFRSIRYPILPRIERASQASGLSDYTREEILHIRHHSLFAPCDFDLSPYFQIVKPNLETGFDHRALVWAEGLEVEFGQREAKAEARKIEVVACVSQPRP
jgi:hypothetical protein